MATEDRGTPSTRPRNVLKHVRFLLDLSWREVRDLFHHSEMRTRSHYPSVHQIFHARLLIILLVTVCFDFAIILLAHYFDVSGFAVRPLLDAVFWASSHVISAGSALSAGSTFGHFLELFMQLYSVIVFAAAAGTFSSFFHQRGLDRVAEIKDGASGREGSTDDGK